MDSQGSNRKPQKGQKPDGLVLPGRVDGVASKSSSSTKTPTVGSTTALTAPKTNNTTKRSSAATTSTTTTSTTTTTTSSSSPSSSTTSSDAQKRKRPEPPKPVSPLKRRKVYHADFQAMVDTLKARNGKTSGVEGVEDPIFLKTDKPLLRMSEFSCPLRSRFCKPKPHTKPPVPKISEETSPDNEEDPSDSEVTGASIWSSREWRWKGERDRLGEYSSLYRIPSQKGRKRTKAHEPNWMVGGAGVSSSKAEESKEKSKGKGGEGDESSQEQKEPRSVFPYQSMTWESDIVWDDSLASFKGVVSNVSVEGWKKDEPLEGGRWPSVPRPNTLPSSSSSTPSFPLSSATPSSSYSSSWKAPSPSPAPPPPPPSPTSSSQTFVEMSLASRKKYPAIKSQFSLPEAISTDKFSEKFEDLDTEWTAAGGEGEGDLSSDWLRVDSTRPSDLPPPQETDFRGRSSTLKPCVQPTAAPARPVSVTPPVVSIAPTTTPSGFVDATNPPSLKKGEAPSSELPAKESRRLWCSYGPRKRNEDLDRGDWLESVVWDEEQASRIPKSKLIVDLNDDVIDYDPLPEPLPTPSSPKLPESAPSSSQYYPSPLARGTAPAMNNNLSFSRETPSIASPVVSSPFSSSSPLHTTPPSIPTSMSSSAPSPSPSPASSEKTSTSEKTSSRGKKDKGEKREAAPPSKPDSGALRHPPTPTANMVYYFPQEDLFFLDLRSSDPFNLSLDPIYSRTKKVKPMKRRRSLTKKNTMHTVPALKLSTFPTSYTSEELREFRRPKIRLRRKTKFSVSPIRLKESEFKRREKIPEGWGKKKKDFSGVSGDLILVEHLAEEFPMMLTAPGMSSDIINYYRKERIDDTNAVQRTKLLKHGRLRVLEHNEETPFFGSVTKGKSVRLMENSLYMVPLSEHKPPERTFLLVRDSVDKKKFHVRPCRSVFAAGQEQMLKEIHTPNSRTTTTIVKNRLQVYIYRMFGKKKTRGIVKHSDIDLAFPGHSDSSIRKCLKDCGSFRRKKEGVFWTLKPSIHLPPEEELRGMVSPEDVCIVESIMAGLQRLQDDGVHRFKLVEDFLHVTGGLDIEIRKDARKVEDLLHMTPWNLSSNFVNAFTEKGNIRLAVKFNEAIAAKQFGDNRLFSFVRRREQKIPKVRDPIASTHADLRKLGTADAKLYLMKFGYTEMDFESLTRWDLIQIVRECSSKAAAKGQTGSVAMFARGARYFANDYSRKYLKDIRDTFEEQLKFIGDTDPWSSDSEDEDEEDVDSEDAEILENYMTKQANSSLRADANQADEEMEIGKDLQSLMEEERLTNSLKEKEKKKKEPPKDVKAAIAARFPTLRKGRRVVLKRTRTVKDADGGESLFVDYIRDPNHVLSYLDDKVLPPPPVTPLGSIGFGGQRRKILRKAPPPRQRKSPNEEEDRDSQREKRSSSPIREEAEESPVPISSEDDEMPQEETARVERTGEGKLIIRRKETKEKPKKDGKRLLLRLSLNRSDGPLSPGSSPRDSPSYSPHYVPSPLYSPSSRPSSSLSRQPSPPPSKVPPSPKSEDYDPPVQSPEEMYDSDFDDSPQTPIYEEREEDAAELARIIAPPEFVRPVKVRVKPPPPEPVPVPKQPALPEVVTPKPTPRITVKISGGRAIVAPKPVQEPTPEKDPKKRKRSSLKATPVKKPPTKIPKLSEAPSPAPARSASRKVASPPEVVPQTPAPKNMRERMRIFREERKTKFLDVIQALYGKENFLAFRFLSFFNLFIIIIIYFIFCSL